MSLAALSLEAVLAYLVAMAARLIGLTLRVRLRVRSRMAKGPVIYAFLHGQQMALLRYPRPRATAALVSLSQDGALQARVLSHLGLDIIRGSTSTGGAAALSASLSWLASGRDLAVAVDGPRGPAGRSKPGTIWLSQKARAPIIPVACAASTAHRLRGAWDSFMIPVPFARVPIHSGEPFRPWEMDWTDQRKLSYLDSLLSDLSARAQGEVRTEGASH